MEMIIERINNIHLPQKYKYTSTTPITFTAYEKTFVMLKPDSFERKLDKVIMEEIENRGLKVLASWEGKPERRKLEEHYGRHKTKPFFEDWLDFLQSGKVRAMIVGGEDAVSEAGKLKFSIRDRFAPNERRRNLLHSSDTVEEALHESAIYIDKQA